MRHFPRCLKRHPTTIHRPPVGAHSWVPTGTQQRHAATDKPDMRCYFYYTNERGDLYNIYNAEEGGFFDAAGVLAKRKSQEADPSAPPRSPDEERTLKTGLPSGPSFLKDPAFLDFFFKHLRVFSTDSRRCRDHLRSRRYEKALMGDGISDEPTSPLVKNLCATLDREGLQVEDLFPFVSLCGKELNFIACEKEPVVFHDLVPLGGSSGVGIGMGLRFAGTLIEPFAPERLAVDGEGYLYHPLSSLDTNPAARSGTDTTATSSATKQMGLVGASVGFKLGFEYMCDETDDDGNYVIEWRGVKTPVPPMNNRSVGGETIM